MPGLILNGMQLKPELAAPIFAVPLPLLDLPASEKRIADSLFKNLRQLEEQANNFSAAVALIEQAELIPIGAPHMHSLSYLWRFIAFREGAMCLSNFAKALHNIRGLIKRCPSIEPLVDTVALKLVSKDFRARFKNPEKLRDTVAHPEFCANHDMPMDGPLTHTHAVIVRAGRLPMPGIFHDRLYLARMKGSTYSYELVSDNSLFLVEIARRVFKEFNGITPEVVAQLRAQR